MDIQPQQEKVGCLNFIVARLTMKGTVIVKIWWQVLFMVLYTVVIGCLHNFVDGLQMHFPLSLIPVLGAVTSLLLVFRTNTAYDRYWEGRKLWSTLSYHLRTLTLNIWVGVDPPKKKKDDENDDGDESDHEAADMVEKLSAINLLLAFVYATKNYLRGEYSYDEEDMKGLISHLPKFQTPSSNKPLSSQGSYRRSISKNPGGGTRSAAAAAAVGGGGGANSGSTTILFQATPTVQIISKDQDTMDSKNMKGSSVDSKGKRSSRGSTRRAYSMKAYDYVTPSNIPLEVAYYLFSYIKALGAKGPVEANVMRNMQASVLTLIDCLTGFERILRTPMPLAYSVHLRYTVWIYLLALPFQFMATLNWWTIPAVTLASFALLGILAIGGEIENPFGYDDNDLPLDDFCKVIRREIQVLIAHPMPTVASWVLSDDNQPLAPTSWLTAQELSKKSGDDIRELLIRRAELPVENFPVFSTNL